MSAASPRRVMMIFGTRPEVIKLAPVLQRLEELPNQFTTINVCTGQHTDLLVSFVELFQLRVDHRLNVMRPEQTLNGVCARLLEAIDAVLASERPDVVVVQGDTASALIGALAAFQRGIAVAHVEAGLRSGNCDNPFPEEMNRQLITRLATWHFAATAGNRATLMAEGVPAEQVFLTGNPIVAALHSILQRPHSAELLALLERTRGSRRIVLTTHRRESFDGPMAANLRSLREFIDGHDDVTLLFPVHPNPTVRQQAANCLGNHPRIHLLSPQSYPDFIGLLANAWLIVSDSGGVQEEAPTLGKPLLILRENTERPEAVECGVARLVGAGPDRLLQMLESACHDGDWIERVREVVNPFGTEASARQIVAALADALGEAKEIGS